MVKQAIETDPEIIEALNKEYCQRLYGKYLAQWNMLTMDQLNNMVDILKKEQPEKLLDVGCGAGVITEYIHAETGSAITAVDKNRKAIQSARKRNPNTPDLHFKVMNFDNIELKDTLFDAVIAIDSLHFSYNIEGIIKNLIEITREGALWLVYIVTQRGKNARSKIKDVADFDAILKRYELSFDAKDCIQEMREFFEKTVTIISAMEQEKKLTAFILDEKAFAVQLLDDIESHKAGRYFYIIRNSKS
ncbi:class I SAM-dependent methyltransferase [candidate division KSB1 bacterium]